MPKPVILTVDDEMEVLNAVARDLRAHYGADYRIIKANSGSEALEVLRELHTKDQVVALVLSDQRMPGVSGVMVLEETKNLFPLARRVLLTAYADTTAAIEAINGSQVHYYLLKPWNPPQEKLYPVLDDQLEDWQGQYRPGFDGLKVIGHRWAASSHQLKDFLSRNQIPYQFLEAESVEGKDLLERGQHSFDQLPVVLFTDGSFVSQPTLSELGTRVGLGSKAAKPFYDLAIVGGGPAGLAAAVYGASEGLKTLLIEAEAPGGQAGTSSRIENYLGFPSGLSGADLARRAVAQGKRFGVEMLSPQTVKAVRLEGPYRILELEDGSEIAAHVVVMSMGVTWNRIPATGAEALTGRGIYYGAAMSEALSCKGEQVFIVGAGNSAGQAALYFTQFADKVIMVVRGKSLEAKMSQYLVDRILNHPNIEVQLGSEVVACMGEEKLEQVSILNRATGETHLQNAGFLFSFIGAAPRTQWLEGIVARDAQGFIKAGKDLSSEELKNWPLERSPFLLETSVPGIFAVGDVRSGSVKRVASAVGEGSVSVSFAHQHLAML